MNLFCLLQLPFKFLVLILLLILSSLSLKYQGKANRKVLLILNLICFMLTNYPFYFHYCNTLLMITLSTFPWIYKAYGLNKGNLSNAVKHNSVRHLKYNCVGFLFIAKQFMSVCEAWVSSLVSYSLFTPQYSNLSFPDSLFPV